MGPGIRSKSTRSSRSTLTRAPMKIGLGIRRSVRMTAWGLNAESQAFCSSRIGSRADQADGSYRAGRRAEVGRLARHRDWITQPRYLLFKFCGNASTLSAGETGRKAGAILNIVASRPRDPGAAIWVKIGVGDVQRAQLALRDIQHDIAARLWERLES